MTTVFSFGFEISTPVGAGGNCWESTCVTEVGLDTRDMRVFASTVEDALFGDVFRDVGEAALLLLIPIVSAIFK